MKLKSIKIQRRIFSAEERELDKSEYEKLISASRMKNNERINLIIQTICSTGIRVSDLKYISVEAVKNEKAEINCKGKLRVVFLPRQLCKALKIYVLKKNIKSGPVFVTKNGKPLHRSNIWNDMKKLGREAGIEESKIFPHNLRHLFARTFYGACRDIVRLADVLGHSSVNTTRIYTMESGENHRRQIQMLDLLRF